MKLASLKAGGRDGTLVVVSRDLRRVAAVPHIAATLQRALENWTECAPLLARAYEDLNAGLTADASDFDAAVVAAPLPRAYQWLDGSAYLHHAELLRRMRNVEMPQSLYRDPLMYQGGSDSFAAPLDPRLMKRGESTSRPKLQ
jgi:fumarylacetoacetate (FAA) hydrolase